MRIKIIHNFYFKSIFENQTIYLNLENSFSHYRTIAPIEMYYITTL